MVAWGIHVMRLHRGGIDSASAKRERQFWARGVPLLPLLYYFYDSMLERRPNIA